MITEDGERIWGRMPDREEIWPRLRYHRYFMLTEFYGAIPPAAEDMRRAVAQSYAQQLMQNHDGVSVELSHVVHRLSTREEMMAGGSLDEPHKYQFTSLGRFSVQDAVIPPTLSPSENDSPPLAPQAELAEPSDIAPPPTSPSIEEAPAVE